MQSKTWMLAIVVAVIGVILLGGAILHSFHMLHRRETEAANTQRLLEGKAYYDSLTNLPNRSLLLDRLGQAIARGARTGHLLAVCFIDLDNFKPINDNFGHDMGDHVLVDVARRLRGAVRGGDTVARFGGDELIVLMDELENEHEAEDAVKRLLLSLKEPVDIAGRQTDIHASIGYVLHSDGHADAQSLIESADKAMYQAKSAGSDVIRRYSGTATPAREPLR